MDPSAKIYVAGHRGLVGSALVRQLEAAGCGNLLLRTRSELDLANQAAVQRFFEKHSPEYVFLAAARVGGIFANSAFPAEFIRENLLIQTQVIEGALRAGVRRLLFLGSSCIYPKNAKQPIPEDALLSGPLEPTNRPYAVAKIAGIELCWSMNRQYGTRFLAAMPASLYGPGDHYDLEDSHVVPALIRKMHEARQSGAEEAVIWGTGTPRREFLYSDDAASACVFLMNLPDEEWDSVTGDEMRPPIINIGCGEDLEVAELARRIARVVGFEGKLVFDRSKPDGTARKVLDVSRLAALGWGPRTSLEQGLRLTYADFLARYSETLDRHAIPTSAS